jgi:hypothetical protein
MDDQAPDVPTSCVVYIATTDGALRMCHLGNFKQDQGLARDPEPMPTALPADVTAALQAAANMAALDEVGTPNEARTCTHQGAANLVAHGRRRQLVTVRIPS